LSCMMVAIADQAMTVARCSKLCPSSLRP